MQLKDFIDSEEEVCMQDRCVYRILVRGTVEERAIAATSPLHVKVAHSDPEATVLEVNADQSGLIGMLRYLHQQGFILLSVHRSAGKVSGYSDP
jgi:hypothetical protein